MTPPMTDSGKDGATVTVLREPPQEVLNAMAEAITFGLCGRSEATATIAHYAWIVGIYAALRALAPDSGKDTR